MMGTVYMPEGGEQKDGVYLNTHSCGAACIASALAGTPAIFIDKTKNVQCSFAHCPKNGTIVAGDHMLVRPPVNEQNARYSAKNNTAWTAKLHENGYTVPGAGAKYHLACVSLALEELLETARDIAVGTATAQPPTDTAERVVLNIEDSDSQSEIDE